MTDTKRVLGRPPGRNELRERQRHTDQLWMAVKRVENAVADLPKLIGELRDEVTELREQVRKAHRVIITLTKQHDEATTDYETLNQQSHRFGRKTGR